MNISSIKKQKGIALLAILSMIVLVLGIAIIKNTSLNQLSQNKQSKDLKLLTVIKNEVLGYSLQQSPPGLLPCPDTDGDGFSDSNASGCLSYLGLFPFRELNVQAPLDKSASIFWYAVDPQLTLSNALSDINSSLVQTLNVDSTISPFILIAPGEPINNQIRNNFQPVNFLEGINSNIDYQSFTKVYSDSNDFNDQLFVMNRSEYWQLIEKKVALDVKEALLNFYNTTDCQEFPLASVSSISPFDSQLNIEYGMLPSDATLVDGLSVGCPASLTLPSWFSPHWEDQIHYVVCGPSGNLCINTLGHEVSLANAIIVLPGISLGAQTRPSLLLNDYLESDNSNLDAIFEYRASKLFDGGFNDQLFIVSP